jgi:peptidyl-prolyl cis-trans isomerase A (cyclophilin A)
MSDLKPGQYAVFDTTLGEFTCELFPDKAPATVQNFIGLAEGTKEFVDSGTRQRTKRRFYDGLTFHRVIPKFMIQGGVRWAQAPAGLVTNSRTSSLLTSRLTAPGVLPWRTAAPAPTGRSFSLPLPLPIGWITITPFSARL